MTRTQAEKFAEELGLYLTWNSPGDGRTRYKIFDRPISYFASDGLYRCVGLKELVAFLWGYHVATVVKAGSVKP